MVYCKIFLILTCMITNSQPWDNLKFDPAGVDEAKRKFFGTIYNTYSFFALYANVDEFRNLEAEVPVSKRPEIDRWVLSLLHSLIKEVTDAYESYEPTRAGRAIQDFVTENLSNWYVRLNRKRFWGGEYNQDKVAAYQTLYTCLETISMLAAPIAPFFMRLCIFQKRKSLPEVTPQAKVCRQKRYWTIPWATIWARVGFGKTIQRSLRHYSCSTTSEKAKKERI